MVFLANSSPMDAAAITAVTIMIFVKNTVSSLKDSMESITSLGINMEARDFMILAGTKSRARTNPSLLKWKISLQ